jgi:hypothetical protein
VSRTERSINQTASTLLNDKLEQAVWVRYFDSATRHEYSNVLFHAEICHQPQRTLDRRLGLFNVTRTPHYLQRLDLGYLFVR